MAWLHENREDFKNAILFTAERNSILPAAVEQILYDACSPADTKNFCVFPQKFFELLLFSGRNRDILCSDRPVPGLFSEAFPERYTKQLKTTWSGTT